MGISQFIHNFRSGHDLPLPLVIKPMFRSYATVPKAFHLSHATELSAVEISAGGGKWVVGFYQTFG